MHPDQTILDLFDQACARYSDKPAFTCLAHSITFNDLKRLSNAFAVYIQRHTDLRPGDRIALQLPNLLQYPVVVFGALRAGLIVVNTNPLYTPREMAHQFSDAGVRALVVTDAGLAKAMEAIPATGIATVLSTAATDLHLPISRQTEENNLTPVPPDTQAGAGIVPLREALAAGLDRNPEAVTCSPGDVALLQYTGGTTGTSKGAMLTHNNLVTNTLQVTERAAIHFVPGEEIYVAPLPLYHIYAFTVHCLCVLHRGGHNILIPDPRNISALVNAIAPFPFTVFVGINTLYGSLCRHPEFRALDFSSLKGGSAGGMALSPEVAAAWREVTGANVSEGYGMTEASPVIASNPPGEPQLGTVGPPLPDTEVKVIDSAGNALPLGEAGELCVKGPQVMLGYWQKPEETAQVLSADGWLKTGDAAVIQQDGYIRIVDRLKEMIVVSGFNVYPSEVEAVARQHTSVRECAAVGIPSDRSGESVKLFVVPATADFCAETLREYLRQELTAYKVPSVVAEIAELPKSNVGKVLRRELR